MFGHIAGASLCAGVDHTCAIVNGGGVMCWGYNLYGQLGMGEGQQDLRSTTDQYQPVLVGLDPGAAVQVNLAGRS